MSKVVSLEKKKGLTDITPAGGFYELCSTCDNTTVCVYREAQSGAVLQCEEYSQIASSVDSLSQDQALRFSQRREPVNIETIDRLALKGLCINCEEKGSCTFSRPDEDIWHCEEYL
ncbi:MAG: hypothetical protein NTV06_02735 [candidate division Zixibacteria bacterium]|nr:hypothetical protein [candidate division Zixibacteria bacterium]